MKSNIEKKCKLCGVNFPNHKKSHIISAFLSKNLSNSINKTPSKLLRDGTIKNTNYQNGIYEYFILCKTCEKKIEIVETIISRTFNAIENKKIPIKALFSIYFLNTNLDTKIYQIFVYTLMFRISISNNEVYQDFNIEPSILNDIINILRKHLKSTQIEFLENIKSFTPIKNIDILTFKEKSNARGLFTSFQSAENSYIIFTLETLIIIHIAKEFEYPFRLLKSNNTQYFYPILMSMSEWFINNNSILQNMYSSHDDYDPNKEYKYFGYKKS